ncbi:LPS assembly lipoprotein LptE [Lutimaribacter sp. EGI FJ00015]|uniref:LPS assembly lipoprotein LptE n=1 Tax=Lutimaribacter degradans TaxID=2945989 RepID=A0ACC5ZWH0_9RHOB|nr:LPS assembly lipoprotein LptE [Lutimaribacter sp. EGI FJ00013]MCM2562540.1 LPS assembly lipoprotein LptE [Lutimaribacter sp. EGI FJ00013]MCO0613697.1 LPS assembly lipoprotein LptE [Lutimaribacter sp. EGI FJ00015]MCO0636820.1 LPS assembly lipoprotein LptE [Lutimaribacter sp. EGI FJ00014]
MSLSKRDFLMLALAVPIAACGFTPAYGPQGGAGKLQNRVTVQAPDTRADYLLVQRLEERLGRASSPAYLLETDLDIAEERMAVTTNNITTRFNLVGRLTYRLRDAGTGEELSDGRVDSFTGYSATGSTVATLAAERDAQARLANILADQLVTRLIASAANLP